MRALLTALLVMQLCACGGSGVQLSEARADPPRPLIVAIGDSITAGYVPTGGVLQLRQDLSYTADLAQLGEVITAAVGGASTQDALANQVAWLRPLRPAVLVIMLGTNDAALGLDRAQALSNVRAIADAWPDARLVLVAPPRWDAASDTWLSAWAGDLKALAAVRGARFVDAYGYTRDGWLCHPVDHHPCAAAHRAMGELVRSAAHAALTQG